MRNVLNGTILFLVLNCKWFSMYISIEYVKGLLQLATQGYLHQSNSVQ